MNKKILTCLCVLLAVAANLARADEAEVRKAVTTLFGPNIPIDAVRKAGILDLYEVQVGTDILYADKKGNYIIQGDIIDVKGKRSITDARRSKLQEIKFADLPLELALKTVRGSGRRVFATFEDPNCGYCKKLAKDIATMNDITMYTFLIPILSADSTAKSKAIWCASDRLKAWNDWMISGAAPAAAVAGCDTPVEKILALGSRIGVRATPTIFLANGERIPGAIPAARLEQELDRVAALK